MTSKKDHPARPPATSIAQGRQRPDARKPYRRPRLELLGDVRDLTLGVTPGGIESGPIPFRPIGG